MSKILLIGYNPPALAGKIKIEAAHYRTWQFLEPLLNVGHHVCLCADGLGEDVHLSTLPRAWAENLVYTTVPFGQRGWVRKLQKAHDTFDPDCVVAVNFSHCLYATKLQTEKPIWMDIYGDMLTIAQAAYYRSRSDRGLATSIAFMRRVLQTGDVFSVCGIPQQHMLIGELAMAGRLNHRTFGYEFAHVVLPGTPPTTKTTSRQNDHCILKSHGIRPEDFVVLWCGGYNTWTDVETLFAGLEAAMAKNPQVHYVSVGANTYNAPDNVYTRLLAMIEQSAYRQRFHMLGWRPWTEVADFYRASDVGLNIDALHYETLYGTRTRLVEMIAAGLPVITTLGSELSYLLQEHGAAFTFEIGDWQTLSEQITALAQDQSKCTEIISAANQYANRTLSFCATTTSLQSWVRTPTPAPDKSTLDLQGRFQQMMHHSRTQVRQVLWQFAGMDK